MRYLPLLAALLLLPLSACQQMQQLFSKGAHRTGDQPAAPSQMVETEDYSKAIAFYTAQLARNPGDRNAQLKLADSYRLSGEIGKAHGFYDRLIAAAGRDVIWISAMEGKGLCYMQEGKFEEAIRQFNVVVTEDAGRWRTLNAIGVALALTGRAKEAMDYYQMALQVSSNHYSVLNNMGLSLALAGETERGIGILEKALQSAPANSKQQPRIALNLALVYGIAGKMDEAERTAKPYLSQAALYNNMSYYALLANNKVLAREYLGRALSGNPMQYQR